MDAQQMREEIKTLIDAADDKVVKMVHAMLEVNAMEEADWWASMPDEVKVRLEKSFEQGENGNVIPHEEVKKMYPQWFSK